MNQKDKNRLLDLAKQQMEIATGNKMINLKKEWLKHKTFKGERPMVTVETWTFASDAVSDMMQCESEEARNWEWQILLNIVNYEHFGDDSVVRDYWPVGNGIWFKPFNLDPQRTNANEGIGYHFTPVIKDLKDDFHKLAKSSYGADTKGHIENAEYINSIFDGILPVKLVYSQMIACLTQNIIHLMDMETMFMSMYDYPELFHEMMNNLSDDYVEYFKFLEREGAILSSASDEGIGQGTYCFTDELPSVKQTSFTTKDVWCYCDSQETVGISADMFNEFFFPYYKKITDHFGLLSYGCCEPVDVVWDKCLSKMDNLRNVSISAWCNEEIMGEKLAGKNIMYHRKPSPNFLGVGNILDEEALREHIKRTLNAAKGCSVEFTQRDVYSINKDLNKVKRFVDIIKEEIVNSGF